jgi:hypothetical protein
VAVGAGGHRAQRDATRLDHGGALAALFAAVDRAAPGDLAAAGGFGDAAVHRQVTELQADHAVIGLQHQQLQRGKDAGGDPLVAPVADGGRRAVVVGDLAVAAAQYQDLD